MAFVLETVLFATRPVMVLFFPVSGFALFRLRVVFGLETDDFESLSQLLVLFSFVVVARILVLVIGRFAFPISSLRGDCDFGEFARGLVHRASNSSEGDGIDIGEELRGERPNKRSGVHGDTERAQFCSGDDEGITMVSGWAVILQRFQGQSRSSQRRAKEAGCSGLERINLFSAHPVTDRVFRCWT